MKKCFFWCIIIINMSQVVAENYTIKDHGRRIQLDGFLLEWSTVKSHIWTNDTQWVWDAISTPEGLTGYVRSRSAPKCSNWSFLINSQAKSNLFTINIRKDSLVAGTSLYQLDNALFRDSGIITFEWVIPWNLILDNTGKYEVTITGRSSCGDSLQSMRLSGVKIDQKQKTVWKGTAIRVVIIAGLSIIFVYLRLNIRRKKNRRE